LWDLVAGLDSIYFGTALKLTKELAKAKIYLELALT